MRLKHKLMVSAAAVLTAAMLPVKALASVKVNIYGDRRVYGKDTPYPYFFIDRKLIGTKCFIRNIALSLLAFFLLGLITFGVSRLYFL